MHSQGHQGHRDILMLGCSGTDGSHGKDGSHNEDDSRNVDGSRGKVGSHGIGKGGSRAALLM
jgi:hypothetical protein